MDDPNATALERLWAEILSEDAGRVRAAIAALDSEQRGRVLAHLREMSTGPGWSDGQRRRAKAALANLTT